RRAAHATHGSPPGGTRRPRLGGGSPSLRTPGARTAAVRPTRRAMLPRPLRFAGIHAGAWSCIMRNFQGVSPDRHVAHNGVYCLSHVGTEGIFFNGVGQPMDKNIVPLLSRTD